MGKHRRIQWEAFSKTKSVIFYVLMWYVVGMLALDNFIIFFEFLPYKHMGHRKSTVFLATLHFEWGLQVSESGSKQNG